jgi:hypothetical protein
MNELVISYYIKLYFQSTAKKEERTQKMNDGRHFKAHGGCKGNRLGNGIWYSNLQS